MRAFVRGQYDKTQQDLAKQGIKTVYLARGVRRAENVPIGKTDVRLHALSSFAADPRGAATWAREKFPDSRVFYIKVPASRIFSTERSGPGKAGESEWVVLGGKTKALVTQSFNFKSTKYRELARGKITEAFEAGRGKAVALVDGLVDVDADVENADWLHHKLTVNDLVRSVL